MKQIKVFAILLAKIKFLIAEVKDGGYIEEFRA